MPNKIIIILMAYLLSNNIIGDITINNKTYNIKNQIGDTTIDQNVVGLLETSSDLESIIGNTILAGHDNTVFKDLKNLKNKQIIIIKFKNKKYYYEIFDIKIINEKDKIKITREKTITLITCTKKDEERLIIKAKLVKIKRIII